MNVKLGYDCDEFVLMDALIDSLTFFQMTKIGTIAILVNMDGKKLILMP